LQKTSIFRLAALEKYDKCRNAYLRNVQVIGAVGFMNQRLEIPKDIDPLWIALMESCWHR